MKEERDVAVLLEALTRYGPEHCLRLNLISEETARRFKTEQLDLFEEKTAESQTKGLRR